MADIKRPGGGEAKPEAGPRIHSKEDFLSLFKRGQEFTEELLQENERLRFQVAGLQEESGQLRRQLESNSLVQDLMGQIKALEGDRQRLLDHYRAVEDQNRDYTHRYTEIEEAHNNLANLYVASYQLHSTLVFSEVVQIISEILLNLIGAEQFVLYLLDETTQVLTPLLVEGAAAKDFLPLKMGEGAVGKAVAQNRQHVTPSPGAASGDPVAVIPLCVGERRVGALLLRKLLVQKPELSPLDLEIFSVLAVHAATALLASAQQGAAPLEVTRALYERLWQAPTVAAEGV